MIENIEIDNSDKQGHDAKLLFENRIEWLSIKDASKLYPISVSTFYKYKENGIPVRKLGGKLVIKKTELEEYLERWAA